MSSALQSHTDVTKNSRIRAVTLATLGNVMEWYDFTVYGFLAIAISVNFFPGSDPNAALLSTFAVFGVGFIARPVGAFILGPLVDSRGRKFVMLLSMLVMAAGSLLVGIAPTYAQIGILAPATIVLGRLLQGFSAGGEFGSSAVFLVEWATPKRRGFFGSFHQVATYGGLLIGVIVVAALTSILGAAQMQEWGWRIPFIFGALLAIVVLYLRRRVEETPVFSELEQTVSQTDSTVHASTQEVSAENVGAARGFFLTIGVTALWAVTSFVTINYMPTFTSKFAGISQQEALWATCFGCLMAVILFPVAGHFSDRFGRRPFIVGSAIAYIVLAVPLFLLIVNGRSFFTVVVAQLVFAIPTAAIAGTGTATVTELFALRRRGVLVSIATAIAVTVFGGFGGFITTLLIDATKSPISASYYVVGVAIITLVAGLALPDLGRKELRS
jgi:MHS family proline/betaine transporter-like MFS transporter